MLHPKHYGQAYTPIPEVCIACITFLTTDTVKGRWHSGGISFRLITEVKQR